MKLMHVVGARPNFMKVAPVMRALESYANCSQTLVHTGQHYDDNMSKVFFKQLEIPTPNVNLNVGSNTHAKQTARIMEQFEPVLLQDNPDLVLVYGDVNSTLACSLVSAKLLIPVAHVEAGLRSHDRKMPEEINRVVTDQLATILFTPSIDANENLVKEGVDPSKIHFVGNVMIDTLVYIYPKIRDLNTDKLPEQYILVTLHRPSNVDDKNALQDIVDVLHEISELVPIIFPVHPRTRKQFEKFNIQINSNSDIKIIDPTGYLEFLFLQKNATAIITDSGGIQEESTFLQVPCLTIRENTERPVTVTNGSNKLIGRDMEKLKLEISNILEGSGSSSKIPDRWDGEAGSRIAAVLCS